MGDGTDKLPKIIAKFRPSQPVVCLVIPNVVREDLKWHVKGIKGAKHCTIGRGLIPVLAGISSESAGRGFDISGMGPMLAMALEESKRRGLCQNRDLVVVIQKIRKATVVKVVEVTEFDSTSAHQLKTTGSISARIITPELNSEMFGPATPERGSSREQTPENT